MNESSCASIECENNKVPLSINITRTHSGASSFTAIQVTTDLNHSTNLQTLVPKELDIPAVEEVIPPCSPNPSLSSLNSLNDSFSFTPEGFEAEQRCMDISESIYDKAANPLKMTLSSSSLALLSLREQSTRSNMLKVRSLYGSEVSVPIIQSSTFADVKNSLCQQLPLRPCDLLLVRQGKEIKNDSLVYDDTNSFLCTPFFMMVRSASVTPVSILCKVDGKSLPFLATASTRIFHLKRQLFSKKITSLRPGCQRLIIGGRQLHDTVLLGDYLLQSPANQRKMRRRGCDDVIMHISRTTNTSHEVDVVSRLRTGVEMKFTMEISEPAGYMREILYRQFFIPRETPLAVFLLMHGRSIQLHPDYTLLDYGVTPLVKTIEIEIVRLEGSNLDSRLATPPSPADAFLIDEVRQAVVGKAQNNILRIMDIQPTTAVAVPRSLPVLPSDTSFIRMEGAGRVAVMLPASVEREGVSGAMETGAGPKKLPSGSGSDKNSRCTMFKGMKKGFFSKPAKRKRASTDATATATSSTDRSLTSSNRRSVGQEDEDGDDREKSESHDS